LGTIKRMRRIGSIKSLKGLVLALHLDMKKNKVRRAKTNLKRYLLETMYFTDGGKGRKSSGEARGNGTEGERVEDTGNYRSPSNHICPQVGKGEALGDSWVEETVITAADVFRKKGVVTEPS